MTDSNLTKVPLREFLEMRFNSLERAFVEHCDEARNRDKEQDQRIEDLERVAQVVKWIGGGAAAVLIAILIAYLKQLTGL